MSQRIIRRIFTLAERLEPDRKLIWDWLLHTHIASLDGHTAVDLVYADRGEQVVALLETALLDEVSEGLASGCAQASPRLH